jgi:arsenite-transporting ATPase
MGDIEVEPVDSVDDAAVPAGVDAPEVVLYGGKGGVGKTTTAAATALASARDGTPTLVLSTDPAHSLSDVYGQDVPSRPARIREDVPLYGAEIDPEEALEEGGLLGAEGDPLGGAGDALGGLGGLFGGGDGPAGAGGPFGGGDEDPFGGEGDDPFGGEAAAGEDGENPLADLLGGGAMPGADEAAAIRLLLEHLDDERFERVVVDTAPTGHTLRLLELPEVLDSMVGRLVTLRQRFKGMLESVGNLFGGEDDAAGGGADLEALRAEIERLRDLLTDPARTDFRVVMVPEEMSVAESRRLVAQLAEYGVPVRTVVVNKVMEDLSDVAGDVATDGAFVSPDLENCEFCARRWEVQQDALAEAQELFRGHDVRRVPLFAEAVRGDAMLRVVAACVE